MVVRRVITNSGLRMFECNSKQTSIWRLSSVRCGGPSKREVVIGQVVIKDRAGSETPLAKKGRIGDESCELRIGKKKDLGGERGAV